MSNWKSKGGIYLAILAKVEIHFAIPTDLLARICYQESRFNPGARSPAGAVGIMQLEPGYFVGAGGNAAADIAAAGKYLGVTLYQGTTKAPGFRDWQLCLAAYNWGPGSVRRWMREKKTFEQMPKETFDYVTEITRDVPVGGCLWEVQIPTLERTIPILDRQVSSAKLALTIRGASPAGSLQPAQPLEQSSEPLLHKSLLQSLTRFLPTRSHQNSPVQLPPSASLERDMLSKMVDDVNLRSANMTTSIGKALVALIESDLATVGGQPLISLMTTLQKSAGNRLLQGAAVAQFVAGAPAMGLTLEVEVEQQLLQMAITWLQGALSKAPPVPASGGIGGSVS